MREFKFRAIIKDSSDDRVNDGKPFLVGEGCEIRIASIMFNMDGSFGGLMLNDGGEWDENDVIDMFQFTGLVDKNGKDIYEGDIIEYGYDKELFKVVWWNNNGRFYITEITELDSIPDIRMNRLFKYAKVVGNIFENPELLKHKVKPTKRKIKTGIFSLKEIKIPPKKKTKKKAKPVKRAKTTYKRIYR